MNTRIVRGKSCLLDVGNGVSKDPLHLLCSSPNRHVKDFLAEFQHYTTKDAWINLKIQKETKVDSLFGQHKRERGREDLILIIFE